MATMTPHEWLALRRAYTRNLKLRALDYSKEDDRALYHPVHDGAHDPVARLLTTIGCDTYFCAAAARLRADRSASPPTLNGATSVIGRSG